MKYTQTDANMALFRKIAMTLDGMIATNPPYAQPDKSIRPLMDAHIVVRLSIHTSNRKEHLMTVHHGGKTGKAASTLAKKSSSKSSKSSAGTRLAKHKAAKH